MTDLSAARSWHDRPLWGIWLMLASVFVMVLGIVIEKLLLGVYPVPQMAFMRALLRLAPLFITVFKHKEIKALLSVQQPFSHFIRLAAYVTYNICILYALSKTTLAMIGSLQYITPFFTIGLGAWFLKEKMDRKKWVAIGITILGVFVAIQPFRQFDLIALLILFASLLGSVNKIMVRKLTATEHSLAITIFGNIAMVVVLLPVGLMDWHPLSLNDLGLFAIAGIFTAAGQFLAVQALRFAQATLIASIDCTSVVWGALFDFFIWHAIPSTSLVLGAGIIIASNFYLVRSAKTRAVS